MVTRDEVETPKPLPPPWDRVFSLSSRVFVWLLLFGVLYILRPFFLLVFLTFVFAYVLEHGVQGMQHRIRNRPARVVLVATVFLATLITIGLFLVPQFGEQAKNLAGSYQTYLAKIDGEIDKLRENKVLADHLEGVTAAGLIEDLLGVVSVGREEDTRPRPRTGGAEPAGIAPAGTEPGAGPPATDPNADPGELPGEVSPAPVTGPPTERAPPGEQDAGGPAPVDPAAIQVATQNPEQRRLKLAQLVSAMTNIAQPILTIGSAFLLSLLFSFLIVLDLPKLSRAVGGLKHTKVGFIYDEVAENIHDFGMMLGRALEAQLFIAICNTILTAIGLYFLDLTDNLVFLSTIVFFCSFIPVAGVFLSSTPICLEALSQSGVELMLFVVGLILIIHFVEAYFLNPRIFGHHLHMNAVLVLIVLTIGGKLFGVWGLVLGLPVVNYFFGHAIRYRDRRAVKEKAAAA